MNITDTISAIEPIKDEPWNGPNGNIWFLQGTFQSGAQFSIGSKSIAAAQTKLAELKPLIGQEGQFEVEHKGEYQGKPKYKLVSWPGKPEKTLFNGSGVGGGKKDWQPRYRDTPEGTRAEQDSIHRSVALTQAVAFKAGNPLAEEGVLKIADAFYAWLSQGQPQLPTTQPAASSGPPTQPSTGSYDPLREQKEFFGQDSPKLPHKSATVQKYLDEIQAAVKIKDSARIETLAQMVIKSFEKKTLSEQDIEVFIDPAVTNARKAVKAAGDVDAW